MVDIAHKLQELSLAPHSIISAECPSCGKYCIVETEPYKYQCLSCNFSRDFSQDKPQKVQAQSHGPGLFVSILIAMLITIALL
jgi:hypothetical protein